MSSGRQTDAKEPTGASIIQFPRRRIAAQPIAFDRHLVAQVVSAALQLALRARASHSVIDSLLDALRALEDDATTVSDQ